MKSILVINTPNNCLSCTLEHFSKCMGTRMSKLIEDTNAIPYWCPLKPMPQKKEVEVNKIEDVMHTEYYEDIYMNKFVADIQLATDKLVSFGWNACLEEIEK